MYVSQGLYEDLKCESEHICEVLNMGPVALGDFSE